MQESRGEFDAGTQGESSDVEGSWEFDERRAAEAVQEIGQRAGRARDDASETLRDARQKLGVAYDRAAERAGRAYRGARHYAQANPGVAAAVTFAAGLGAGLMLSSRNGAQAYRRGLIPVVAVALAQAVLDVFEEAQ
jgi:ElaB/YqjD/DUF883 family membrane-anchored ribosome-binding protein